MRVTAVRVQNYRCIDDSGWVPISGLSCFIGRNESGKTSFLEALESINPAYQTDGYEPYEDYPRQDWREYSRGEEVEIVVQVKLELDEEDKSAVENEYTDGILSSSTVIVGRDYANEYHWDVDIDPAACIEYLLEEYRFEPEVRETLHEADSLTALSPTGVGERAYTAVVEKLGDKPMKRLSHEIGETVLFDRLPVFQYIGEYATISGTIDVQELLSRRENGQFTREDRAFLSLLTVAGLDIDAFSDVEDWRETTAELEAASADISEEAMSYWSQSGDISIRIQHAADEDGNDLLDLRVENHKHGMTVEFEQRSQGFRRFFSTFCQLSALKADDSDRIVMVDEPGHSLHVRAKQEFLEFLKSEISSEYPLLYTTHSPFMIDAEAVHDVKLVTAEPQGGKNVFSDTTLADATTKFPLRNVFEFDLMETLLVTPYALLVEERADHTYLSVVSNVLDERGNDGLDSRWTVVPVQSHRNISTFTSLFGEQGLNIAALLRTDPTSENSRHRGESEPLGDVPITTISEYTTTAGTTTEDLFSTAFYLDVVNRAYAASIRENSQVGDRLTPADLPEDGPIVDRLEQCFEEYGIDGGTFDRYRPAVHFRENRDELVEELDSASIRTFTKVCAGLNATLHSFEGVEPQRTSILDAFRLG